MDSEHIENTKRIAKNTLFLTGRMVFSMFVSLYTSRLVLQALGVDDYGLYGVVGGLVAMFSLISGTLQAAISRFITYEIGVNDPSRLQKTFSSAFFIQGFLALAVFVGGETIGVWFLNNYMVIAPERLYAANVVFQASIFSFMLGLILMPYSACINAHERMNIFAYFDILSTMLRLAIVLFIAYSPLHFDRLIVYSILLVGVGIIMQFISVAYCRRHFSETKVKWIFDKDLVKQMGKFAGWNFIGAASGLFRDQGGNILLNLYYGTAVNAARSVAGSVSGAVSGFTGNFMAAVNPQITKSYATGDTDYMMNIIFRSSRFGFMFIMIFAIPIMLSTQYILTLWLKTPPVDSAIFVRLLLVNTLIEVLSYPLITVMLATGDIKKYQIVVGGINCLTFPISWVALAVGFPAYSIFVVSIVISIMALFARLAMLKDMIQLNTLLFIRQVVARCLILFLLCLTISFFMDKICAQTICGLSLFVSISLSASSALSLYMGCNKNERSFLLSKAKSMINKFRGA